MDIESDLDTKMKSGFLSSLFRKKPSETVIEKPLPIKILLVDAEEHTREIDKVTLQRSFLVFDFSNEFDAVEYIRENHVDIAVINDSLLEDVNAARTLFALRENCKQSFRAFALCRYHSELQHKYLRAAGFEEILSKPIDFLKFSDTVYFKMNQ